MTSTLAGPVSRGRHRFGRLGLVPVTFFVVVARRGLLQSWRQPGRHRPYVARPGLEHVAGTRTGHLRPVDRPHRFGPAERCRHKVVEREEPRRFNPAGLFAITRS